MIDRMLAPWQPTLLSLLRFVTGLLFFHVGIAKRFKFPVVPMFAKLPPLIQVAGTLELIGGFLIMIGLFTRPVAFILSGLMACAYFIGHMFKGGIDAPVWLPLLNGGSASILYCFIFLYLSAAGGGPQSADAIVRKKG